ncbi:hypothetical protein PUNSTDRAFT_51712 [Punctularia strigosozonata HHB-11173 SS5]|uniref:uncharacterized protein n=1 Tax=Punctularia strigosozonata (strain HHB-11173) TaxID=741275 RepID=UPI0004417892|nr:uncharacterized protein PUNSTDRAFT_51712 [Punctularia strigosozonata HHB-11173 SS5]EIN09440.1 hypothetical protein PUNSTDRAFT_51712 [Punctularia strigosozonata HHB-11173 SS5]
MPRRTSNAASDSGSEKEQESKETNEGEFEIEAIVKHSNSALGKGIRAYYVKWKGYDDEENSWVTEQDAAGAQELIDAYWAEYNAKKNNLSSSTSKAARRASTVKKTPDRGEPASTGTKRGRKPRTSKATEDVDMDADADDRVPAKKRKSAGKPEVLDDGDAENTEVHDMAEYAGQRSWEGLVHTIDTVERDDDENLTVYFRLTNGSHRKERSSVCAEKFPKKLIKFYESNLRWKSADADGSS